MEDRVFMCPHQESRYPTTCEESLQCKGKSKVKRKQVDDAKSIGTSDVVSGNENVSTEEISKSNASSALIKSGTCPVVKYQTEVNCESEESHLIEICTSSDDAIGEPPFSPYAPLKCPVCSEPECPLNKAGRCILLDASKKTEFSECYYCGKNCSCNTDDSKILPVSGLVDRDENGVAKTLLKENGGFIEDSYAYANRPRWVVPYGVKWDFQLNKWITAFPLVGENDKEKSDIDTSRKRSKSKLSRKKSKVASLPVVPRQASTSECGIVNGKIENERMALTLEGDGFKVFTKGDKKILINYEAKNCKYLGCCCAKSKDQANGEACGCEQWVKNSMDKTRKASKLQKEKQRKKQGKISILKETSRGLVAMGRSDLEDQSKSKGDDVSQEERNEHGKESDPKTTEHLPAEPEPATVDNKKEVSPIIAKDLKNQSQTSKTPKKDPSDLDKADDDKNSSKGKEQHDTNPTMENEGVSLVCTSPERSSPETEKLGPCECSQRYTVVCKQASHP